MATLALVLAIIALVLALVSVTWAVLDTMRHRDDHGPDLG